MAAGGEDSLSAVAVAVKKALENVPYVHETSFLVEQEDRRYINMGSVYSSPTFRERFPYQQDHLALLLKGLPYFKIAASPSGKYGVLVVSHAREMPKESEAMDMVVKAIKSRGWNRCPEDEQDVGALFSDLPTELTRRRIRSPHFLASFIRCYQSELEEKVAVNSRSPTMSADLIPPRSASPLHNAVVSTLSHAVPTAENARIKSWFNTACGKVFFKISWVKDRLPNNLGNPEGTLNSRTTFTSYLKQHPEFLVNQNCVHLKRLVTEMATEQEVQRQLEVILQDRQEMEVEKVLNMLSSAAVLRLKNPRNLYHFIQMNKNCPFIVRESLLAWNNSASPVSDGPATPETDEIEEEEASVSHPLPAGCFLPTKGKTRVENALLNLLAHCNPNAVNSKTKYWNPPSAGHKIFFRISWVRERLAAMHPVEAFSSNAILTKYLSQHPDFLVNQNCVHIRNLVAMLPTEQGVRAEIEAVLSGKESVEVTTLMAGLSKPARMRLKGGRCLSHFVEVNENCRFVVRGSILARKQSGGAIPTSESASPVSDSLGTPEAGEGEEEFVRSENFQAAATLPFDEETCHCSFVKALTEDFAVLALRNGQALGLMHRDFFTTNGSSGLSREKFRDVLPQTRIHIYLVNASFENFVFVVRHGWVGLKDAYPTSREDPVSATIKKWRLQSADEGGSTPASSSPKRSVTPPEQRSEAAPKEDEQHVESSEPVEHQGRTIFVDGDRDYAVVACNKEWRVLVHKSRLFWDGKKFDGNFGEKIGLNFLINFVAVKVEEKVCSCDYVAGRAWVGQRPEIAPVQHVGSVLAKFEALKREQPAPSPAQENLPVADSVKADQINMLYGPSQVEMVGMGTGYVASKHPHEDYVVLRASASFASPGANLLLYKTALPLGQREETFTELALGFETHFMAVRIKKELRGCLFVASQAWFGPKEPEIKEWKLHLNAPLIVATRIHKLASQNEAHGRLSVGKVEECFNDFAKVEASNVGSVLVHRPLTHGPESTTLGLDVAQFTSDFAKDKTVSMILFRVDGVIGFKFVAIRAWTGSGEYNPVSRQREERAAMEVVDAWYSFKGWRKSARPFCPLAPQLETKSDARVRTTYPEVSRSEARAELETLKPDFAVMTVVDPDDDSKVRWALAHRRAYTTVALNLLDRQAFANAVRSRAPYSLILADSKLPEFDYVVTGMGVSKKRKSPTVADLATWTEQTWLSEGKESDDLSVSDDGSRPVPDKSGYVHGRVIQVLPPDLAIAFVRDRGRILMHRSAVTRGKRDDVDPDEFAQLVRVGQVVTVSIAELSPQDRNRSEFDLAAVHACFDKNAVAPRLHPENVAHAAAEEMADLIRSALQSSLLPIVSPFMPKARLMRSAVAVALSGQIDRLNSDQLVLAALRPGLFSDDVELTPDHPGFAEAFLGLVLPPVDLDLFEDKDLVRPFLYTKTPKLSVTPEGDLLADGLTGYFTGWDRPGKVGELTLLTSDETSFRLQFSSAHVANLAELTFLCPVQFDLLVVEDADCVARFSVNRLHVHPRTEAEWKLLHVLQMRHPEAMAAAANYTTTSSVAAAASGPLTALDLELLQQEEEEMLMTMEDEVDGLDDEDVFEVPLEEGDEDAPASAAGDTSVESFETAHTSKTGDTVVEMAVEVAEEPLQPLLPREFLDAVDRLAAAVNLQGLSGGGGGGDAAGFLSAAGGGGADPRPGADGDVSSHDRFPRRSSNSQDKNCVVS